MMEKPPTDDTPGIWKMITQSEHFIFLYHNIEDKIICVLSEFLRYLIPIILYTFYENKHTTPTFES